MGTSFDHLRRGRQRARLVAATLASALAFAFLPTAPAPAAAANDGVMTTLAGLGSQNGGFGGDGGPATSAKIAGPRHLVIGPDGSVYFAHGGNNRVRRIA